MYKKILFIFCVVMLLGFVSARVWTPVGDIDLQNFFSIKNGVTINSSLFCTGSSCGTVAQFLTGGGGGLISTSLPYLYDNAVTIFFNETKLNETIIDLGGSAGNSSWNQTLADTLYLSIDSQTGNASWNESLADTLYSGIEWGYNQTQDSDGNWIIRNSTMDFNYNETKLDVTIEEAISIKCNIYNPLDPSANGCLNWTKQSNTTHVIMSTTI